MGEAGRWYCRRTAEGGGWLGARGGGRGEGAAEGRVGQGRRCRRGGSLRRKDEKRGKNIRKGRERDKDDARKERKGVGWLALVFEFKYQTVREEPRVPRSPCSRKTPVTLTLSLREINEAKWVPWPRCRQRATASLISFFPFLDSSLPLTLYGLALAQLLRSPPPAGSLFATCIRCV